MQVRILRSRCCGSGFCAESLPDVFSLDSKQKAVVLSSEGAPFESLLEAAEACPCEAIEVEDDEGGVFP